MNETSDITIKARRVCTLIHQKALIMMIYEADRVTRTLISTIRNMTGHKFRIDIEDETGEFTTGARWLITDVTTSGDGKAITMILEAVK